MTDGQINLLIIACGLICGYCVRMARSEETVTEVQKIPHEGPRVETGVVQFGDDWPGIFIRGDNAMAYALQLGQGIGAPFRENLIENLAHLLRSCDLREIRKEDAE